MAAFLSRRRIGPEPGRARRAASPLPYYGTPDRATARAAGLFQIAGCRSELGDAQRHRAGLRHRLPPALVTPSEGRALPPAMLPEAAAPLTRRNRSLLAKQSKGSPGAGGATPAPAATAPQPRTRRAGRGAGAASGARTGGNPPPAAPTPSPEHQAGGGHHPGEGEHPEDDLHMIHEPGPRPSFGELLDPEHRAPFHDEVDRLEDQPVEDPPAERAARRSPPANQQAGPSVQGRLEHERPAAVLGRGDRGAHRPGAESEGPAGQIASQRREADPAGPGGRVHPQLVTQPPCLGAGAKEIFGGHSASDQVFQEIEAVESAAVLAQLGQD